MHSKKLVVPLLRGNYSVINKREISYFFLDKGVVFLVDLNQQSLATSKNLSFFENILNSDNFFRINRSYLINLMFLKHIYSTSNEVQLECGEKFCISRSCLKALKSYIEVNNYQLVTI